MSPDKPCVLAANDLSRYKTDGILHIKDFFSQQDLAAVVQDMSERLRLLEKVGLGKAGEQTTSIENISKRLIALETKCPGSQSALYDAMNDAPAMHRFAANERLLGLLQQVLSPTIAIHSRLIVLMSMPQNEWHLAVWHQDWFYNEGPSSTVTLYIPLQETLAENGSLLVAPGAHRNGFVPHDHYDHGVHTKWLSLPPEVVKAYDPVVSTHVMPGDMLLFNSLVPHAARLNTSNSVRFVINLRYRNLEDAEFLAHRWALGPMTQARQALARKQG